MHCTTCHQLPLPPVFSADSAVLCTDHARDCHTGTTHALARHTHCCLHTHTHRRRHVPVVIRVCACTCARAWACALAPTSVLAYTQYTHTAAYVYTHTFNRPPRHASPQRRGAWWCCNQHFKVSISMMIQPPHSAAVSHGDSHPPRRNAHTPLHYCNAMPACPTVSLRHISTRAAVQSLQCPSLHCRPLPLLHSTHRHVSPWNHFPRGPRYHMHTHIAALVRVRLSHSELYCVAVNNRGGGGGGPLVVVVPQ